MFVTYGVRRSALAVVAAVGVLVVTSAPAFAQEPKDPNPGAMTLTGSIDFLNQYMFRGIRQNSTGIAMWPAVDLGIAVYSGDGGLKSVGINFGTWNSLHTGDTGSDSEERARLRERQAVVRVGLLRHARSRLRRRRRRSPPPTPPTRARTTGSRRSRRSCSSWAWTTAASWARPR